MRRFLALSADKDGQTFTTARAVAHILTLPTPDRPGGDVIAHYADGKGRGVCGKSFAVKGGEMGTSGAMCEGCAEFAASDAYGVQCARTLKAWAELDVPDATLDDVAAEVPAEIPAEVPAESQDVPSTGEVSPQVRKAAKRAVKSAERKRAVSAERERLARQTENREDATGAPVPALVSKGEAARRAVAVVEHVAAHGKPAEVEAVERAEAARALSAAGAVAARRDSEGEARKVARVTDGKCAVLITDPNSETGAEMLLPLRGMLAAPFRDAIAAVAPDVAWVQVKLSAWAVAPRPGTDSDGVHGVCPFCRERVTLTGTGGIGTHRLGGVTPDGPQLSGREIPAVEHGHVPGDTAAAAKRRSAEAYREETVTGADGEQSTRIVAVVDRAGGGAPVGARDHGRSDGVALVPLGETGYAGVKFDDEPGVGSMSKVGGRFGWLSSREFDKLSRGAQRNYWRKVGRLEKRAKDAKALRRETDIAAGRLLPSEVRRNARKDATVGKSDDGHTLSHYGKTEAFMPARTSEGCRRPSADSVEASLAAAGVKNGGRGMAKSPRKGK